MVLENLTSPSNADIHLRTDYIELICLVNPDRQVSISSILSRFRRDKEINVNLQEIDENSDQAVSSDTWILKARDWFSHLNYRAALFGDFYPFELSEDKKLLTRKESLSSKHKLYIFLLMCSSLRCFDNSNESLLTSGFEFLSVEALKKYLPSHAQVHLFGANRFNTNGRYSIFQVVEKIEQFATDIHEECKLSDDDKNRLVNKGGDRGLDIVAWISLGDSLAGSLLILGQCTCKEDWYSKQFDSSYDKWRNFIFFAAIPNNMMFIPYCFRDSSAKWFDRTRIANSIILDRMRLVYLLRDHDDPIENIPYELIEKIVDYVEPIV